MKGILRGIVKCFLQSLMIDLNLLWFILTNLFSDKFTEYGRYDNRDLLLGHGIDNLFFMRIVVALGFIGLVSLWLNFMMHPHFLAMVAFSFVYGTLVWYVRNLPECGIQDILPHFEDKNKSQYRSYLGGRILFTPQGLSLSLSPRQINFITGQEHRSQASSSQPQAQEYQDEKRNS